MDENETGIVDKDKQEPSPKKTGQKKAPAKKTSVKKTALKKSKSSSKKKVSSNAKRGPGRKVRPYPLGSFQESYEFAKFIYDFGSGQKVRRLSVFDKLGKSPDSSLSRTLITNSNKYGLIKGSYVSEFLELTTEGVKVFVEDSSDYDRHSAQLNLVINDIPAFKFLFERFKGNKLPNQAVISDILREEFKEIEPEDIDTVVDLFIVNCQYLKLLKLISGAERLVNFEFSLEEFSKTNGNPQTAKSYASGSDSLAVSNVSDNKQSIGLDQVCFYITPIGDEGTEERKHSDLFLGSIVEPALEPLHLKVIRADYIDKPGTITKQIIEYLSKAKLVIADLSFNNPNVFYELAIRHALRLPTVQIIRKGDKIPFDVNSSRTISIDTTDIFSLVPKLDTYRAEIANQVRQALKDPDNVDNPLTSVYPNIKLKIE